MEIQDILQSLEAAYILCKYVLSTALARVSGFKICIKYESVFSTSRDGHHPHHQTLCNPSLNSLLLLLKGMGVIAMRQTATFQNKSLYRL